MYFQKLAITIFLQVVRCSVQINPAMSGYEDKDLFEDFIKFTSDDTVAFSKPPQYHNLPEVISQSSISLTPSNIKNKKVSPERVSCTNYYLNLDNASNTDLTRSCTSQSNPSDFLEANNTEQMYEEIDYSTTIEYEKKNINYTNKQKEDDEQYLLPKKPKSEINGIKQKLTMQLKTSANAIFNKILLMVIINLIFIILAIICFCSFRFLFSNNYYFSASFTIAVLLITFLIFYFNMRETILQFKKYRDLCIKLNYAKYEN